MSANEDDERFAELIRLGFGVDVTGPAPQESQVRPEPPSERPSFVMPDSVDVADAKGSETEFFDFDASFARADRNPDDYDAFRPPTPEPILGPRTPLQWVGMICLVLSTTLLVLTLFGLKLPVNVVMADILVLVGSIAIIWRSAPARRPGFEDYDDGARI